MIPRGARLQNNQEGKRRIVARANEVVEMRNHMKVPVAIAKQGVDEYDPKSAMQMGEIRDQERTLKDALDYKVIPAPKTAKDVEGMIDIVYRPANKARS